MSALTDPAGGSLDQLVETQRGMTDWEADWFLRTGQLPDFSQPPIDEPVLITDIPPITEAEARAFLAGEQLTAGAGWGSPSEIALKFDPNQERDSHGRWTDDGSSIGVLDKPPARSSVGSVVTDPETVLASAPLALVDGRKGPELECRPPSLTICAEDRARRVRSSLTEYRSNGYGDINSLLRRGEVSFSPETLVQSWVDDLDHAMATSRLSQDVRVMRGLEDADGIFGMLAEMDDDLSGFEWTEHAFVSTTSSPDVLDFFGVNGGVVLNIRVPAGTGAVQMSEVPGNKRGYDEAELLLERGLKMRVVQDHGHDRRNRRVLDVEVVPA